MTMFYMILAIGVGISILSFLSNIGKPRRRRGNRHDVSDVGGGWTFFGSSDGDCGGFGDGGGGGCDGGGE